MADLGGFTTFSAIEIFEILAKDFNKEECLLINSWSSDLHCIIKSEYLDGATFILLRTDRISVTIFFKTFILFSAESLLIPPVFFQSETIISLEFFSAKKDQSSSVIKGVNGCIKIKTDRKHSNATDLAISASSLLPL